MKLIESHKELSFFRIQEGGTITIKMVVGSLATKAERFLAHALLAAADAQAGTDIGQVIRALGANPGIAPRFPDGVAAEEASARKNGFKEELAHIRLIAEK
jgi:hypothetical protein